MSRDQALRAISAGSSSRGSSRRTASPRSRSATWASRPAASALHASLLGVEPVRVCEPGTGLAAGGPGEVSVVERALAANPLSTGGGPVDTLAALGGFEIALLTRAILAASERLAIVLDGSSSAPPPSSRAALQRPAPTDRGTPVPGPGHRLALDELGLDPAARAAPLRLGEGTGAALALPLLQGRRRDPLGDGDLRGRRRDRCGGR